MVLIKAISNYHVQRLEHDSLLAIEWFQNNNVKLNQDKYHLLVSGYKHENVQAQIGMKKFGKVISKVTRFANR